MNENLKPQNINIAQLTFSIFETVRKVERGDIQLEAEFQRNFKWLPDKKSKLIESIILDIPIQAIYLSEDDDYKYEIIDGQQRIRTIVEFVNNKFKLQNTVLFKENKLFKDLEPSIQRKIEDFQLVIFVVKKDNNPDIKFEIFERINTGAVRLNSQELRNCIYRNKGIPFIKQLVKESDYRKLIKDKKVNINSMQDQELVLRFMSFYYRGIKSYGGNLKKFLNETLDNYDDYRHRESEFKNMFLNTVNSIYNVFGKDAFVIKNKNKKGKLNVALFEILMISFSKYDSDCIEKNKKCIKDKLEKLLIDNESFRDSIVGASTTIKTKAYERFEIWDNCMEKILGE
ncbi:DUF262 domain-containing protein [Clostridium scatologenes]|uniref:GmrSD restriction endonucleases N-terminal domain-containing protein n=1 Tax=Clostridium scatologenes TaxID=1548 RepID=A0A0E3GQI8_CLOSL|nr:DUF262 domain-containing protein [Clostridium scatologenes]AKA68646.1 protein of unknown function DUF262 [Clostridium scatologenes]